VKREPLLRIREKPWAYHLFPFILWLSCGNTEHTQVGSLRRLAKRVPKTRAPSTPRTMGLVSTWSNGRVQKYGLDLTWGTPNPNVHIQGCSIFPFTIFTGGLNHSQIVGVWLFYPHERHEMGGLKNPFQTYPVVELRCMCDDLLRVVIATICTTVLTIGYIYVYMYYIKHICTIWESMGYNIYILYTYQYWFKIC
jgi:hypothetical protein